MAIFPTYRKKENFIPRLLKGHRLLLTHREFERLVLPELGSINIDRLMKDNVG
jgi:hypothetical protein